MRPGLVAVVLLSFLLPSPAHAADTVPSGWFELTVPGGWRTLARYGVAPEERALALTLIARQRHGVDRGTLLYRPRQAADEAPDTAVTVAAPFTAAAWRALLRLGADDDLFAVFERDRQAMFVCVGATATDRTVRALLIDNRDLLERIYRESAAAFAVVARSLRVGPSGAVIPGGADTAELWTTLAGESPTKPAAFFRALLARDHGRLAWFYDTLSTLPPDRLAFVLGGGDRAARLERARALYESFRSADASWRLDELPFVRNVADAWSIVTSIAFDASGMLGPTSAPLWEAVFDDETLNAAAASERRIVALPWLVREITSATLRERRDRYEMLRLAQRAFPHPAAAELVDIAAALRGYRTHRALLLTLERLGVVSAPLWARAVRTADSVDERAGDDRRTALIAFQGALALVERIRIARTVDVATTTRLLSALFDQVEQAGPTTRAVSTWMTRVLLPALPPAAPETETTAESIVLQAMAGPLATDTTTVDWEGLPYRVDLGAAEYERLTRIRAMLGPPGLDAALESGEARAMASALLALTYTPALGDPDGVVALARDVPQRHDFGLTSSVPGRRRLQPWLLPDDETLDGESWHARGSLLGLDLALARLWLRRVADEQMPAEPSLHLNDLMTFARTVVAINARDLTDPHRDAIVAAIGRGRSRVTVCRTAADPSACFTTLAIEAQLSPARRETLAWLVACTPDLVDTQFAPRDLLWLGHPELAADVLDRWGVDGRPLDGRLTTTMAPPVPWDDFSGRPDSGQMATQVPDLTLRLAEETARMRLPAVLIPSLLAFAVQDYWHDVDARFGDDWPAMTRAARDVTATRVEDYVAALTGRGPLRSR